MALLHYNPYKNPQLRTPPDFIQAITKYITRVITHIYFGAGSHLRYVGCLTQNKIRAQPEWSELRRYPGKSRCYTAHPSFYLTEAKAENARRNASGLARN